MVLARHPGERREASPIPLPFRSVAARLPGGAGIASAVAAGGFARRFRWTGLGWLVGLGAVHVGLAGGLAAALGGEAGFGWHFGFHAALFVPLGLVLLRALGGVRAGRREIAVVLGAAALSRVLLLATPPVLSGDLYRTAWEGQVVLAGHDPWAEAPDHPELGALRERRPELRERVEYWKLPAIDPPLTQLFAAAVGTVSPRPLALKGALVLTEGILIAALLALLSRRGRNPLLIAGYAWNPLPLTETAGSGHSDALGVALLALGVLAAERGRRALGAGFAALSGMAKFAGFALVPFLLRAASGVRRKAAVLGVAAAAAALPLLPFLAPERLAAGVAARRAEFLFSLSHYARHWRFNESLFLIPEAAFESAARPVALGILLGLLAVLVARRSPPGLAIGILAGSGFLLSPVAHPWYLLWSFPFLLLYPERRGLLAAGLTMTLTVALSYHAFWNIPAGLDWTLPPWIRAAEYLPVAAAAFFASRQRGRRSRRRKCATASAAAYPAPNPLSMFTTVTPGAQQLSSERSAVSPPQEAP